MDFARRHALHEADSFFLIRAKRIAFLTNNTSLAPHTVGELYRLRWQGGAVLQMDQAAPAHQGLLRYQRTLPCFAKLDGHDLQV
jgi:hypothetical protein